MANSAIDKSKLKALASATTTTGGVVELATSVEVTTGTDTTRAITADALANSSYGLNASSAFGTDNVVLRADGTGRGVQASGLSIDDSDNLSGVNNVTGLDINFVSGTAGASGNLVQWNADGDAVDSAVATSSLVTASSTNTFTNKTIDANGTGNSISNLEVADFAASAIVIESEGIGLNDNDTTIPTSAAVKDYADSLSGIGGSTGATDNAILRADGVGGSTVQNSGITIDDLDNVSSVNALGVGKAAAASTAKIDLTGATTSVQGMRIEGDAAAALSFSTFVNGDSFVRFTFLSSGEMSWGSGAAVADTNLYRDAANLLKTDDSFETGVDMTVGNALSVTGTTTLATSLTGLLRADSGVVSVDTDFGTRYIQVVPIDFTTALTTGDGKFYIHIPAGFNGMNLTEVHAEVITAGTTGTTDIQIHNVTDTVDMLSTKLTIDSGETGSDTAATAAVIDTANDDVATNDLIRIDVDAVSTTAPQGLLVTLGFEK